MLQHVELAHFAALKGQLSPLYLADGRVLTVRVDEVSEKPLARMRADQPRMPFTVSLTTTETTDFLSGGCAIDLPGLGRVGDIFVSRVAPLDRDPSGAYFCIVFT